MGPYGIAAGWASGRRPRSGWVEWGWGKAQSWLRLSGTIDQEPASGSLGQMEATDNRFSVLDIPGAAGCR
jgi:hypothetical protein